MQRQKMSISAADSFGPLEESDPHPWFLTQPGFKPGISHLVGDINTTKPPWRQEHCKDNPILIRKSQKNSWRSANATAHLNQHLPQKPEVRKAARRLLGCCFRMKSSNFRSKYHDFLNQNLQFCKIYFFTIEICDLRTKRFCKNSAIL